VSVKGAEKIRGEKSSLFGNSMNKNEQTIRNFYVMGKVQRSKIVSDYHKRMRQSVRTTARDFGVSVGQAHLLIQKGR